MFFVAALFCIATFHFNAVLFIPKKKTSERHNHFMRFSKCRVIFKCRCHGCLLQNTSKNVNLFIFYQSCNNFIYQPARKPCSKWNSLWKLYALYSFYQNRYKNERTEVALFEKPGTIYARNKKKNIYIRTRTSKQTACITN